MNQAHAKWPSFDQCEGLLLHTEAANEESYLREYPKILDAMRAIIFDYDQAFISSVNSVKAGKIPIFYTLTRETICEVIPNRERIKSI